MISLILFLLAAFLLTKFHYHFSCKAQNAKRKKKHGCKTKHMYLMNYQFLFMAVILICLGIYSTVALGMDELAASSEIPPGPDVAVPSATAKTSDAPLFDPNAIMRRLRGVSRLMNADGNPEEADAPLLEIKDIANDHIIGLKSFKEQLQAQDREGLLAVFKSSVDNAQDNVDMAKELDPDSGLDLALLPDSSDLKPSMDDIPTSLLAKMIPPQLIDNIIEMNENFVPILEKAIHRRLDEETSFYQDSESYNDYDSNEPLYQSFSPPSMFHAGLSTQARNAMMRRARINAMGEVNAAILKHAPHLKDSHAKRHRRRLKDLQDDGKCLSCRIDDKYCTCKKLFNCALEISLYDYLILMTKGLIDTDSTHDNFGSFKKTIDQSKLIQFLKNIGTNYNEIQASAKSGMNALSTTPTLSPTSNPTTSPTQMFYCGCPLCNKEVYNTMVTDSGGTFSCGGRIGWLQEPERGDDVMDEDQACALVASQFTECGACQPLSCGKLIHICLYLLPFICLFHLADS